ncbi:hypothetical protein Acr_27g0000120 [Actinidia rufa]|uniref:Uncharacterized protein n=1 Tax=Actinidia rufa TaxID=165716 RepID=A0A7J0H594_9ERIC|nr:hypothetical protein Acr_27g0000120 [Actinidia rufa]
MEIQEKKESPSPLPVSASIGLPPSLEKNSVPEKPVIRNIEPGEQHITLSNALDEVHHKETLMERLEMLEKRVLQEDQDETSTLEGRRNSRLIQEETSPQTSITGPENRPKSRKQKGKSSAAGSSLDVDMIGALMTDDYLMIILVNEYV